MIKNPLQNKKQQTAEHNLVGFWLLMLTTALLCLGCDFQRKKKCEWYLVPNPKANSLMEPGWVSLCVANFKLGKQRCYFTAKPNFVEKLNGVPFIYSTMEYTNTFPRKILSVKTCDEGK